MDEDPEFLVVSTTYSWLADLLASAGVIRVVRDYGFDAPSVRAPWWVPAPHAARLAMAGVPLSFSAPGPAWLSGVPSSFTGRSVWSGTLEEFEAGKGPSTGWVKPAEAKVSGLPAAFYSRADFSEAARRIGLPSSSAVQASGEVLDLGVEFRAFVLGGEVVGFSPYLDASGASWDDSWSGRTDLGIGPALEFASYCAATLSLPHGAVLDVAELRIGGFVVLEANPAWCSNPYGADPAGVVRTVLAANKEEEGFAYRPDPYLTALAARKRLLAPSSPTWSL